MQGIRSRTRLVFGLIATAALSIGVLAGCSTSPSGKAAGAGFHATVCDINTDMLEVGHNRALAHHLDQQVSFVEGNAEALTFPDRSFDASLQ